eukprot:39218_1
MDELKRKTKILMNIKNVMNQNDAPNIEDFQLKMSDVKIHFELDAALDLLSNIGDVGTEYVSFPPTISVKTVKTNSAVFVIGIHATNTKFSTATTGEYKIEFCEISNVKLDNDSKDEKK